MGLMRFFSRNPWKQAAIDITTTITYSDDFAIINIEDESCEIINIEDENYEIVEVDD